MNDERGYQEYVFASDTSGREGSTAESDAGTDNVGDDAGRADEGSEAAEGIDGVSSVDSGSAEGEGQSGIDAQETEHTMVAVEGFEDFSISVNSKLDALNASCLVLVLALFMSVGAVCVQTLIRSLEKS